MIRNANAKTDDTPPDDLGAYAGRWIAHLRGRVLGQGGTPEQALAAARQARFKESPEVMFVPMATPFKFSQLLERLQQVIPDGIEIYLVGGAVRDAMLSRLVHDYDFVLAEDALPVARRVANRLGGAYFALDVERRTARVLYSDDQGVRYVLDFATFRGPDLESDLRDRDFTVNAMALSLRDLQTLYDPLGGASDLWNKLLRACSPTSILDDPVRVLRAIRLAAQFGFRIHPDTRAAMRKAAPRLAHVSPERVRDELLRILGGPRPHTALRALDRIGALQQVYPELMAIKGVDQSPPHTQDVWGHTLDTLKHLEILLNLLGPVHDENASANMMMGLAVMRLGRYRRQITQHVSAELVPGRPLRDLIFLAALSHDLGKPRAQKVEEGGEVRFFRHEQEGAELVVQRGKSLHLSNAEVERLRTVVFHHMRPTHLARQQGGPSARAIYRFFRDTGTAGVDICLLSLADLLATYGTTLPQERWARQLEVVRALLDAWWEHPQERVRPPQLISGQDLIDTFDVERGPQIGLLLEKVREAQVEGSVTTRAEALAFIRSHLKKTGGT